METKNKKQTEKSGKENGEQRPKSKFTLFREKYPEGIGEIVNMRAVLR
jgi:hypothetical protein